MNRFFIPAVLVGLALVAAAAASGDKTAPLQVGRYQIATRYVGDLIVIDTATGHTWTKPAGAKKWQKEGSPVLQDRDQTGEQSLSELLKMNFSEDLARVTVHQRSEKPIPGTDSRIYIAIDDITGGQTLLSVIADSELIVDEQSVSEGNVAICKIHDTPLYIRVAALRNFLVGEDFAELEVSTNPLEEIYTQPESPQETESTTP